jgi:hypothetical protein
MKIRENPETKQLSWDDAMALPLGSIVRDLEGETGTVLEREYAGSMYKRVQWDDGCVTMLNKPHKKYKTDIYLLRRGDAK